MIKAELIYNPYLLETDVRFNGQPPRINSLVEKYQSGTLQNWIKLLPEIFYDEMNGYDFELEFSGTARDFSELVKAFDQAGVSSEQVKIFHKNELEGRDDKQQRITDLLKWLEDNPNRNYDNDKFRQDNEILFDGAYTVISFQSDETEQPQIDWAPATIEVIKDVRELDNTDLTYTPIIVTISASMIPELQEILRYFKERPDVIVQQVFFRITNDLNEEMVYRIIKDLGIKKPHFIQSLNDESLKKYFELYPVTEYIAESIAMFRQKSDEVEIELNTEKAEGEQTNSELDQQIQKVDEEINALRTANEEVTTRNNIDKPSAFTIANNRFTERIGNWRKKKTKIVQTEEAEVMAKDLYRETTEGLDEFIASISDAISEAKEVIDNNYKTTYEASGHDDGFCAEHVEINVPSINHFPDFQKNILKIKKEEKVRKMGVGLFYLASSNIEDDYEMQTAYYLQQWREHVFALVEPLIHEYMNACMSELNEYNNRVTIAYHDHIEQAITEKSAEKETLEKQLSSESKQLQQDTAWLTEFKQQLKAIERG